MSKPERHVFVCVQSRPEGHPRGSCAEKGSMALFQGFQQTFEAQKLWSRFLLTNCGCIGPCHAGPSVLVYPEGIMYTGVKVSDIAVIVEEHLLGGMPVKRLFADPEVWPNDV